MLVHGGQWPAHELKERIDREARQGNALASDAMDYVHELNIIKAPAAKCLMDGVHAQCGMVQLFQFEIGEDGRMRDLLERGEAVARWLGYTKMMITLTSTQRHNAAREYGFVEVDSFVNRRTQNTVYVLTKKVQYDGAA